MDTSAVLPRMSTLTRPAMTHNQHRSLTSAAVATALAPEGFVSLGLLLVAGHGPLEEETLL